MIRAYDYFGYIDLGSEEDDPAGPYEDCPICFHAVPPANSEFIYQDLCLQCTRIIHLIHAHPYHTICQSVYIPVPHDSVHTLGLIKMRLYNMIESFTSTESRNAVEIIKDLMEQTPADLRLISLINASLIPLLVTKKFNRHRITYMVHVALNQNYINSETCEGFYRRIDNLN